MSHPGLRYTLNRTARAELPPRRDIDTERRADGILKGLPHPSHGSASCHRGKRYRSMRARTTQHFLFLEEFGDSQTNRKHHMKELQLATLLTCGPPSFLSLHLPLLRNGQPMGPMQRTSNQERLPRVPSAAVKLFDSQVLILEIEIQHDAHSRTAGRHCGERHNTHTLVHMGAVGPNGCHGNMNNQSTEKGLAIMI